MDKIKQIEAFVNAAEKGSLAKASLVLGITPVMLGRRIDALERRLGIKLMHRTTRHLDVYKRQQLYCYNYLKIFSFFYFFLFRSLFRTAVLEKVLL